ncbi:hemolysin family protein [Candidatus Spongiihabitans sp.]|uniref:hemolysin family protein n=1 Tax=Candidatus Spongiihabitans sp. TaxID=3101308 RepID=UPI003C7C7E21
MTILALIALIIVLLLLKGFFSGSEIALVNSDKVKLTARANQGNSGAKAVLELFKTPDVMLGTTLVGTNIATVALTTLVTVLFIELFGARGDLYAVLVFTPVLLILGEIVPKSIFQQKSDELAPIAIYPLKAFAFVFYPAIFIFSRIARLLARLLGGGKVEQNLFTTREQIRSVVEMTERTSSIDAFDRGRIRRVIRFGDTTVGEAMIPIAEVTAINHNRGIVRAIATVRQKGYNRLPVYKSNISNIVGIATLTTWDMMEKSTAEKKLDEVMQPAQYVLQFQTIDQLLPILRQREDHMAVVVDEYGSAIGIITMEDIVEEVVGDIDVGYDFEEYLPRRKKIFETIDDDTWLVDSRLSVSEVNDLLEINLNTKICYTIGGLIMMQLGHIPERGEDMMEQGYRFIVEERTDKAIVKIKVEKI